MENKVNRLKDKADLFLKEDKRVVVKTYNKDWFFCDILIVGETRLTIQSFSGKRTGQTDHILWIDIYDIEEYLPEEYRIVRGDEGW